MYGSAKRHTATQRQAGRKPSSRILHRNGVRKTGRIFSHGELFFCVSFDEMPGGDAGCTQCPLARHASVLSPLAHVPSICFDLWSMCWSGVRATCGGGACVNVECLITGDEKTP